LPDNPAIRIIHSIMGNRQILSTCCLGLAAILTIASCNQKRPQAEPIARDTRIPLKSVKVADSIVYDVIVRDIDGEDPWEAERLQTFSQDTFVNYLFQQLYAGKYKAYHFETGKQLSAKEIRAIESQPGYNRSRVSKLQFNEQWYFDSTGVLNKRVNGITLGLEAYSSQGTFKGHKALFRVKF